MANPNALIVEVVGDTTKLTSGLKQADRDLQRFASRASSWDKRSARTGVLANSFKEADAAIADADTTLAKMSASQNAAQTALGGTAVRAAAAGFAVYALGQNLSQLGGTAGKIGKAFSQLSSGDLVGFVRAAGDTTEEIKKVNQELLKSGDAAKAGKAALALEKAGLDDLAAAALNASKQLQAMNDKFVDATKIHDPTSPGAIAGETSTKPLPKPRPGATQTQRNQWFDSLIARELDRAQTSVPLLRQVAAEIQKRLDATKDITRRLTLEDQLVAVQRRIESSQTNAAKESARLAKERAAAEKARLAALKAAALARQQSRDDLALGLQTPGVSNLRTQLAQLSGRSDIGSISSRLAASLAGARRILSRSWKTISEDSRSNIAALFQTIRDELNKGATGGPLTKTTQLSENVLAGLGLSAAQTRTLRARISHFNSAGTALAGAGGGTITVNTVVDGKVVARVSSKYNGRTAGVNTTSRNGPNAGGWTGRG